MPQRFLWIACVLAAVAAGLLIAQTTDPAMQGNWTVIAGQHGGKSMDTMTGGTMIVKGDQFEIHTAGGSHLKGRLQFDMDAKPKAMSFLHENGLRWQAIYEVSGDDFRLNYIDATGPDKLPTAFRTTPDTEATLVILKRAK